MQMPRRTTECETPLPAARHSRPSRLQQPSRRPSVREGSLTRSSSAEPLNTLSVPSTHLWSSSKRQRSNSVSNARTPQRTPTRITPYKGVHTGEKHRPPVNDKRWIQEQIFRITEHLQTVDNLNTDFLNRGGLKTMSIKEFVGVVNYFLKFVAGNKFTVGANHVESISKILNQIDYPYTMNKSWLKTPTALHAFGNVVMLFSYFMEFIPPSDNLESFRKNYGEESPDMDLETKLCTMAEEGFALWNNKEDEKLEKLQRAAVDELVFIKTSILGCDAFDEEVEQMNARLDSITSEKAIIADEEEYFRLDKEVKTNQRRIAKLQKIRQENQKLLKHFESQLSVQMEQTEKMKSRIDEIRNVVESQVMSIEARNELIEEVSQMQYILKTKKQSVCDLQEMDHQSQILLSRHIKQLAEKVAKFNSYIRQIMPEFKDFVTDTESLCLHQKSKTELQDQIDDIVKFLKQLQKHIANQIEEFANQSEAAEGQIKLISYEIAEWIEPKTKEMMENSKAQQKIVEELDREMIAVTNFKTNRVNELAQKWKQTNDSVEVLKRGIERNREELLRRRKENEAMMTLVKERFEESLTIRDAQIKRFHDALQVLHKKCADAKGLMNK